MYPENIQKLTSTLQVWVHLHLQSKTTKETKSESRLLENRKNEFLGFRLKLYCE